MRVALGIEYDGSQYYGWQSQAGLLTVQSVVESALTKLADMCISIVCAGRTDTGVHATNQVVHFDSLNLRSARSWVHGGNSFLPKDVCIKWAVAVPDAFHARYSAVARRYRYIIYNSPNRPAVLRSNVTWQYRALDSLAMAEAGHYLLGEHDYTSFRSAECQSNTPLRHISALQVFRYGELIVIDITANAFLHHMVRNIAGVLIAVGSGKKPVAWVQEVLQACDRRLGAETAPSYGLYLVEVYYPEYFKIVKQPIGPFFIKL